MINIVKRIFRQKNESSKTNSLRKIYFIIASSYGSYVLYGNQISEELNNKGYDAEVINVFNEPKRVKGLKNSIVVFIKAAALNHHRLLRRLKKNHNTLIFNPADGFLHADINLKEDIGLQYFDGVIMSNQLSKKDWSVYFKNDCAHEIIYHHWDYRVQPNVADNYKLLYAGIVRKDNIEQELINGIEDLNIVEINSTDEKTIEQFFEKIKEFNCHFSVRKNETKEFKYKSNVKLSLASATNSNLILTRDQSYIELLDESYPYYTDYGLELVKEKIAYSKDTYGTKVWNDGLEMLAEVKERTSLNRISSDYINFFSKF